MSAGEGTPAVARMVSLAEALQQAVALHQAGRLPQAARLYRAILDADPNQFDALRLLALIDAVDGRPADARGLLDRALAQRPDSAAAHMDRASVCKALGEYEEALASCCRALALRPDSPDLVNLQGAILLDLERYPEALVACETALALQPASAATNYNRGLALQLLQRPAEALASYDDALRSEPAFPEALHNRGNVLHALGRYDEALASWDLALAQKPDFPQALHSRGLLLHELRRHDEALVAFDRAVALDPGFAAAFNDRGLTLNELLRHDEALASCEQALAIRPDYSEAFINCGVIFSRWKRYEFAVDAYNRALLIKPDSIEALHNRGLALQQLARYKEAAADFARALEIDPAARYSRAMLLFMRLQCCDWREFEPAARQFAAEVADGTATAVPFPMLCIADAPTAHRRCAEAWVAANYPPAPVPLWRGERYEHERIRVAYLSADFKEHAMAYLMAELFERHDRARFEVTGVSWGSPEASPMRTRLMGAFERFVEVQGWSDPDVARLLRELEIDIAVDLNGFTHDGRLGILAQRPAPVQVNYLGYPGTLGAPYIDYIVADTVVIPEEDRKDYAEQVAYLPDSYQVNDRRRRIAEVTPTRGQAGLPERGVVFCSFNNNCKITPEVFAVWMRLLQAVEGSVLWLLEGNAVALSNLRREAQARGVSAKRLVFAPRVDLAEHLARHRLADLFLDTLPYNAHTTTSDALWAGLPVVTCLGAAFAGRVAGSLLRAAGLPELVTTSLAEYEALSLRLARKPEALAAMKAKLVRNRDTCALFDSERFRRHLEAAYATMWERVQRGEAPAGSATPQAANRRLDQPTPTGDRRQHHTRSFDTK